MSLPKPSPRKPGLLAEPERRKTGWEAGTGGRGPRGGRGWWAAGTPGSCKGRGLGLGRLGPVPLRPQQTHIFIHSFNKCTFIRSCLCQSLCWARGWPWVGGMTEVVTEASGKVPAPQPSLSCRATTFPCQSLSFPFCDKPRIYSLYPKQTNIHRAPTSGRF